MTSGDAARALLRRLGELGANDATPGASTEFAFERDFDSDVAFPDLPYDPTQTAARYDVSTRPDVHTVIDASASAMRERAADAFVFVDAELQRVLLRRWNGIDGATSSSNRDQVGRCVLTNIDRSPDRVLVCIEALVHEAIHQHLYRIELASGNFCDLDGRRRYRSPWSGNRIPLHSLVHASFVYFGLLGLWSRFGQTVVEPDAASFVRDRIARSLFGYAFIREAIEHPAFPRDGVQPAILDALGHIVDFAGTMEIPVDRHRSLRAALRAGEDAAWLAPLASGLVHLQPR